MSRVESFIALGIYGLALKYFAVDLTGAQFGWDEIVLPLNLYYK